MQGFNDYRAVCGLPRAVKFDQLLDTMPKEVVLHSTVQLHWLSPYKSGDISESLLNPGNIRIEVDGRSRRSVFLFEIHFIYLKKLRFSEY